MLKRLLIVIATTDRVASVDSLARSMGVSRPLAKQLMGDLVRTGHLRPALADCSAASCSGCPAGPGCQSLARIGLWELTEKGWQAAQALSSVALAETIE
jgi:hypothetical protein